MHLNVEDDEQSPAPLPRNASEIEIPLSLYTAHPQPIIHFRALNRYSLVSLNSEIELLYY